MTGAAFVSRIAFLVSLGLSGSFPLSSLHAESSAAPLDGATTSTAGNGGAFRVQAGAFRSEENARSRCDPLVAKGLPLTIARGTGSQGGRLFFCRSAQRLPHAEAQALAARLRADESLHDVLIVREQSAAAVSPRAKGAGTALAAAPEPVPEAPPSERQPPGADALDPTLKTEFERFMNDRESALEYEFRADFEHFMAERQARASATADAPAQRPPDGPQSAQRPQVEKSDRVEPQLAAAPVRRAAAPPAPGAPGVAGAATALGGSWCGELLLYKGLAPQTWEFLAPQRVRISFPILVGASRGEMRSKEEDVELTPDRRVRLVSDGDVFHSEAVYEIDGPRLRGVSYYRVDKRTGEERSAVPDTLKRCRGGSGSPSDS